MYQYGMSLFMAALLFGSGGSLPQRQTDFSGTWTLADSRSGSDPASGGRGTAVRSGEVGGAVVNCGVECAITQTSETLTVSRPAGQDGKKTPDGIVAIDGRPMSGNTTAKWDRGKLVLTRSLTPSFVVTQSLSLEGDRLTIVVAIGDNTVGPFTLTYTRK